MEMIFSSNHALVSVNLSYICKQHDFNGLYPKETYALKDYGKERKVGKLKSFERFFVRF